jgi:tryptophan synthase alpha chain
MSIEAHLRARRDAGRKLLMPYVTGGITDDWVDHVRAFAAAGADVVEVGLPFSDPTLDGATIQEANDAALARGATAQGILDELAAAGVGVPLVASTYCNLAVRLTAEALDRAGIGALIVPDLPLDEHEEAGDDWLPGVELVLLASPATPEARLAAIARRSRGFVYAVSVMGTTGERDRLAGTATELVERLKRATDRPILVGFGVSTPEHAVAATRVADGVIVGAAIVRQVLDGATPQEVGAFVAKLREGLDREEA